jgi:hypothetical protein
MVEQYVGIELHKPFFQAFARDAFRTRCWEGRFERGVLGLAVLVAQTPPDGLGGVEASVAT